MSLNDFLRASIHAWHGVKLGQPDWSPGSHSLAFGAELRNEAHYFHVILNAHWEPLDFELPVLTDSGDPWLRWIDTALDTPDDIVDWQRAAPISGHIYKAAAHSVVALVAGIEFNNDPGHLAEEV
jgi:glycogen operon protein